MKLTTKNCELMLSLSKAEHIILSEEGTSCFKDYTPPEDMSVEDFVEWFFTVQQKHATCSETGVVETGTNRNRSLVDIFRCARHYYPTATLEQCIRGLKRMREKKVLGGFHCDDIHRFVMGDNRTEKWKNCQVYDWDSTEFGRPFGELLKLVND